MKKHGVKYVEFLDVDKDYTLLRVVFEDGLEHRFWGRVYEDGRVVNERDKVVCVIAKEKAKRFRDLILREIRRRYAISREVVESVVGTQEEGYQENT